MNLKNTFEIETKFLYDEKEYMDLIFFLWYVKLHTDF
jgi:hypothetical protein